VARSVDEGKTFAAEAAANSEPTGACGCCGLRAFATGGALYILYRGAAENVHRDMFLLASPDGARDFRSRKVQEWNVGQCVMSSAAFAPAAKGLVAAWETREQVYWAKVGPGPIDVGEPTVPPGKTGGRKHPVAAVNARGETALAWTEGTGWQRGGAAAWQVFDREGKPMAGASGRVDGVPTWSLVAVWARPDGGFTVMY
jgi:hypothetical protein